MFYKFIDKRIDYMIQNGWVEEVRVLVNNNVANLTTKQLDIANVSSSVLLSIIVFAQLALPIIINKK